MSDTSLKGQGRKDALAFDPEDLVLVTDPKHPLYDERVHMKPSAEFVANIKQFGVIQPIVVRNNGVIDGKKIVEVVAGRQRTMAARVANKQLETEGDPRRILVYAVVQRGNDTKMAGIGFAENEARFGDDPLTRAKKMQQYVDMGQDEHQVATTFCTTVQTVRTTLKLLDLSPAIQKAVADGTITASFAAKELSQFPREQQEEKLNELIESGATKGAKAADAMHKIKQGQKPVREEGTGFKMRSRVFMERFHTALKKSGFSREAALIGFVLGSDTALRMNADLAAIAEEAGWTKREK